MPFVLSEHHIRVVEIMSLPQIFHLAQVFFVKIPKVLQIFRDNFSLFKFAKKLKFRRNSYLGFSG